MLRGIARRMVPDGVKRAVMRSPLFVRHRSAAVNVYHCCVQKTASRWVRRILTDRRVFRYSGLRTFDYHRGPRGTADHRGPTEIRITEPLPRRRIATPLYVDYTCFRELPKPRSYRAFFVSRDPRDIVVSWYFSMKNSHPTMGGALSPLRAELRSQSREDGLRTAIDRLEGKAGLFDALRSWSEAFQGDTDLLHVRYRDLTGARSRETWRELLDHCDVPVPDETLAELLSEHSFRKLSGRRKGNEDVQAHLRKGVAGDWRNHFTEKVLDHFEAVAGDVVVRLGYDVQETAPGP